MAILINAHQVSKSFTSRPLFEGISISVESGERIGLIGPNGAGKSTLLRILAGELSPDNGTLSIQKGLRIGHLEQVPRFASGATVESTVLEALREPDHWEGIALSQEVMSKLSLDGSFGVSGETLVETLSGGWKRRVALARELCKQPDLFLVDEPTNHLDIESILWLEDLLANAKFATIIVTHDRLFLQRVSNRILELDRRHQYGLLSVKGDYATYLETREQVLATQELHEQKLRNTLRRETEWLRRGAKARQTKQQARIQNAESLRQEVVELTQRNQSSAAKLEFQSFEKNPKKLIEAKKISKKYSNKEVIPPFNLLIGPRTRLGLLGGNGCGKTTLIKLLVGLEQPDEGLVFHSERLKVAYFEQNREELDLEKSVQENICPKGDWVEFRGERVHVRGYLSRFLFSHEQIGLAVRKLSGGEQNRLLLARLMLNPANVLVLDEPTNDLDMATLDVLAQVLEEFDGAVILVTHDRYFLDQATNQILAFGVDERGQRSLTLMSGLEQWENWFEGQKAQSKKKSSAQAFKSNQRKTLGYKEQREFDGMELRIQSLEAERTALEAECLKSETATKPERLREISQKMIQLKTDIDQLYERWDELERKSKYFLRE